MYRELIDFALKLSYVLQPEKRKQRSFFVTLKPQMLSYPAVFMGMGEPMLNISQVVQATVFLMEGVGIGARHITISTVGVPNSIMKLAGHKLQITLAVSLHAPNQKLREEIVPRLVAVTYKTPLSVQNAGPVSGASLVHHTIGLSQLMLSSLFKPVPLGKFCRAS